jgi:hypothetical protein
VQHRTLGTLPEFLKGSYEYIHPTRRSNSLRKFLGTFFVTVVLPVLTVGFLYIVTSTYFAESNFYLYFNRGMLLYPQHVSIQPIHAEMATFGPSASVLEGLTYKVNALWPNTVPSQAEIDVEDTMHTVAKNAKDDTSIKRVSKKAPFKSINQVEQSPPLPPSQTPEKRTAKELIIELAAAVAVAPTETAFTVVTEHLFSGSSTRLTSLLQNDKSAETKAKASMTPEKISESVAAGPVTLKPDSATLSAHKQQAAAIATTATPSVTAPQLQVVTPSAPTDSSTSAGKNNMLKTGTSLTSLETVCARRPEVSSNEMLGTKTDRGETRKKTQNYENMKQVREREPTEDLVSFREEAQKEYKKQLAKVGTHENNYMDFWTF